MNNFFAGVDVGRKNIVFGVVLFLVLGVVVGVPLTVDLFGGSMLTESQYQTWKVLHAYGVFTAFVNFFFGFCIDRQNLTIRQKEIASWSFLVAGLVGGIGRPVLFLLYRSRVNWQLHYRPHRDGGICRWDIYICSQPDARTCGLTTRGDKTIDQESAN